MAPQVVSRAHVAPATSHPVANQPRWSTGVPSRAVREHGAKMVALSGADATNTWRQLEVLFTQ